MASISSPPSQEMTRASYWHCVTVIGWLGLFTVAMARSPCPLQDGCFCSCCWVYLYLQTPCTSNRASSFLKQQLAGKVKSFGSSWLFINCRTFSFRSMSGDLDPKLDYSSEHYCLSCYLGQNWNVRKVKKLSNNILGFFCFLVISELLSSFLFSYLTEIYNINLRNNTQGYPCKTLDFIQILLT